jgi:hypothetical protein
MSRQISVSRSEHGLSPLNLNDPEAGYYVSDEWSTGGIVWQRYNATSSPWVNGDRIVGQRLSNVDEIFTIYVHGANAADLKLKIETVIAAFSQYRYSLTINWDGATFNFMANGAADVKAKSDNIDPVLWAAGWHALEITVPREPGNG